MARSKAIVVSQSRVLLRQRWHFVLVAVNGEILATSENYVNKVDCMRTARSIANTAEWEIVVEDEG